MEKRISDRYIISCQGELLYSGKIYAGVVKNVSEKGLYVIAYPLNESINFSSGTTLELKFNLSSKEIPRLSCEVKWSYKTLPHGLTHSIGTEIMESSLEYDKFLKSLISRNQETESNNSYL